MGCSEQQDAASEFEALLEEERAYQAEENPLVATARSDYARNDELPSVSAEDEARRAEQRRVFLRRLEAIDRAALDAEAQVQYDLFERRLRAQLTGYEHKDYLAPLTHENGPHSSFIRLASRVPFDSTAHYEDYIARLEAFPAYMEQHMTLMREGLETGYTQPSAVLGAHVGMIDSYLVEDPTESALYEPFTSFPETVPEDERARLRQEGQAAIAQDVLPTFEQFQAFLEEEYIPGARETVGLSELPEGAAYYESLVRYHTTLDVTADEVHRTGMREVERIRTDMMQVLDEVGFEGSFAAFLGFLRTDPQFYAETPEALMKEAAYLAKEIDGKLPSVFHLESLPRRPYGVEPVPADLAPNYTGGRYSVASGSDEAGFYWVNTYDLDSRPLYVLPALTMHEAVPGHHLQIARAQEMEDERGGVTAFTEGWALYAEYLGTEMGIYDDPYEEFGRLTYEMWRACRLVVDTGLHAKGWTREEARDFLASNTALSLHEVRTEIDRYIAVPGQALAYKMGELKIRELRQEAEEALGPRFDVRDFHEAVLRNGSIPLSALEEEVRAYIQAQQEEAGEEGAQEES